MEPDLNLIRLQQLLKPFENTGITNTSSASPFLKSMSDIAASGTIDTDLVSQLKAEEAAKLSPVTSSVMYDEFPPGFSFRPQGLDTSRFTGVDLESGYLDRAGSYNQDVYAEQEKQKGGGIGGLFKFLLGLAVPGAGFLMNLPGRGLEGIRSLNQRLRNTDFGQSKTLQEYMSRRKERDAIERAQAAAPSVYQSAKDQGFTGPRGGFSTTGRYNESAFSSTKSSRGRQDF